MGETTKIDGDRLMTTKELAVMLHVSEDSINRDRIYGTGIFPPYLKIGKSVRYRSSTVNNWLNGQAERKQTNEAA